MQKNHRVLIVGSGLAGLCCAKELHKNGVSFKIFESESSVGGRVKTDAQDGFLLDRGFQVLLTSYPEARKNLNFEDLGLGKFEPGAMVRHQGQFHRFVDPWRRPMSAWSTLWSPLATIGDKLRIGRLRFSKTDKDVARLNAQHQVSTQTFLQNYGFSSKIIDNFFRPFFSGVFLESDLATSSLKFEYLFRMFSTGIATLPKSGMQAIPQQLADGLPSDRIEYNAEVSSIADGQINLTNGRQENGSHVVLATPAQVTFRLLGNREEIKTTQTECHYFSAEKSPLSAPYLVLNSDESGPINTLCVPSDANPGYAPSGQSLISVSVSSKNFASHPEELVDAVRNQCRSWFGEAVERWKHLKSFRINQALPLQTPDKLNPAIKNPHAQGTTYVCGDHMGISSIQSAMESGRLAAEAILSGELSATHSGGR